MAGLRILICVLGLGLAPLATRAGSDPAIGTWETPPDRKDLTAHVEIRACGAALCGRVTRAFDASGAEVTTKNVGKELFWDMTPEGGGRYGGGTVAVPLLNVTAKARMLLQGDRLTVEACKLGTCEDFVWRRAD